MAARDMANVLNDLYLDNGRKQYWLTKEEFKRIAAKRHLHDSYVGKVAAFLREYGYWLLCDGDFFAVLCRSDLNGGHAKTVDDYV